MKLTDKANVIVVTYDVADCNDTLTNVLVDAFSSYAAAENFIIKRISEELQSDFACGEFIKTKQNIIDLLKTARNDVNSLEPNESTTIGLMSYIFDDCTSEMSSYEIRINPNDADIRVNSKHDIDADNTEYDLAHIMSIECDEEEDDEEE